MQTSTGAPRPITRYGTPVLHRRCAEVTTFDNDLGQLVVDCPDATGTHTVATVVNPVLHLPEHRDLVTDAEGCLSVPGQHAELARCTTATVSGFDIHGHEIRLDGTGTLARCFQHEVDHLDGLTYVDRLPTKLRKRILAASAEHPGVGVRQDD
ncbi:peptide deformylase [Verrucosispora sioxanthis]|uniref:Peptide deformylase n=1 Tax=Verrucosispora sioxanthis TaxID=2499994 RepID=A0A6M1L0B7_9ACTN|nr:peptide deformylase [Verrucosispora sioxanthis]NEE64462.1 peptide deformylase [Verrucosispora sioxanthis]NGM13572.1 peptide deformylase [Verrucosispora sioxanthis]